MSSTTAIEPAAATLMTLLRDHEVHRSRAPLTTPQSAPSLTPPVVFEAHTPTWRSDYRRVPPYRPLNRSLEHRSQRTVYQNVGEQAFVNVMLHGVWLNSNLAHLWRATGGKWNDSLFRYKIGGEW
ncbi:hypothetical protein P152DRAFT_446070 [Eremomyces bilateralis CBS 781.70]|uniref:Uncharacterized protein n=1 Tax=Eremomyces bilateralis CBS 781.70 TaxID=1392243 RepID=A0A6G1GES9_9PEZI|nr:uncharacterized protein P152DRAFT_446070 [Eremomyces bilateralis CBS 781.70]KAF1816411.1 hypothetical protein P152DRAFT_446070 [Eremomyces bilateralis CBS 781.70]